MYFYLPVKLFIVNKCFVQRNERTFWIKKWEILNQDSSRFDNNTLKLDLERDPEEDVLVDINPLKAETSEFDGGILLALRGELDVSSAETFRQALKEAMPESGTFIVHLNVDYIDSEGLKALIQYRRMAKLRHVRLGLVCSERAKKLLDVTKLNTIFEIFDTVERAIAQP